MAELIGPHRMIDRMSVFNDHYARQHAQNQQRWEDDEARRQYDSAAQLTRAESERQSRFYNDNAGLFNDTAMTDMSPRTDAPLQVTGVTGTTPPAGSASAGVVPPATPTPTPTVAPNSAPPQVPVVLPGHTRAFTTEQLQSDPAMLARLREGQNDGTLQVTQGQDREGNTVYQVRNRNAGGTNRTNIHPSQMLQSEAVAWQEFVRAKTRYENGTQGRPGESITNEEYNAARERLRQSGLSYDVATGQIYRIRPDTFSATTLPEGGQTAGLNPEAPGIESVARRAVGDRVPRRTAGLNTDLPATSDIDSVFDGINDTSRPLQPTREMRLADAAMRNDLERAQLYAAHGRPELAAEAFGRALQQRAGYITQERTVMYRAAANGSMRAMERLIEEYNGYGRGEVRVQHAGGSNFALFIQNEGGEWVQASRPLSRDAMLSSLQNLVDAEGAAARSEANREYMTNVMNNQTELAVAGIVADTAQDRMFTDVQIARMSNDLRRQLAAGNVTQVQNEETGTTELYYPRFVDGEVQIMMEEVSTETQRTADTNGRREAEVRVRREVPVATRATGVVNVRAN